MMTTNLTQPVSKKLLALLLIVAFGAEVILYLTRFSSLASSLYDAIMVSSIFVAWRIHGRMASSAPLQKTKLQVSLQFTGAFLLFFLGSTVINIYSTNVFPDFSNDYDQYVQDYTDTQTSYGDNGTVSGPVWTFFDNVDTLGYDLYTDTLAGFEEVWRLSYMILILFVCKKLFRRRWESGRRDIFIMLALFLTSIVFGIDHTLSSEQPWAIKFGSIITFANMGFIFGIILLWTRNLWLTIAVHGVYDIMTTVSWYYFDYAVEALALLLAVVHVILLSIEATRRKQARLLSQGKLSEEPMQIYTQEQNTTDLSQ